jgi:phage shock protein PspC (stress-responsive transcriptional regulator)
MKKLHLSSREKMISGVCGGLSESLGIDVMIIRAVFVVSLFLGGTGLLAYLVLMVVLPKDNNEEYIVIEDTESPKRLYRSWENRMIAGVCGGIAAYLKLDASLMRLVFVGLLIAGVGIPVYFVLWLIIPLEKV